MCGRERWQIKAAAPPGKVNHGTWNAVGRSPRGPSPLQREEVGNHRRGHVDTCAAGHSWRPTRGLDPEGNSVPTGSLPWVSRNCHLGPLSTSGSSATHGILPTRAAPSSSLPEKPVEDFRVSTPRLCPISCTRARTLEGTHTHAHARRFTSLSLALTCTRTYTCEHTCTRTHMYTHTYTHAHEGLFSVSWLCHAQRVSFPQACGGTSRAWVPQLTAH